MIWILVASVGNQRYLADTLKSIQKLAEYDVIKVVVSYFSTNKLQPSNIDCSEYLTFERTQPLSLMDHYELLSIELPIENTDRVMLFDDNDILLPSAVRYINYGSFVGRQILVESDTINKMTSNNVGLIEKMEINSERIVDDFSGTTTSGCYFKEYFQNRGFISKIAKNLEDAKYMEYIEKLPDFIKLEKPIVVHRLQEEPPSWINDLRLGLDDFEKEAVTDLMENDRFAQLLSPQEYSASSSSSVSAFSSASSSSSASASSGKKIDN